MGIEFYKKKETDNVYWVRNNSIGVYEFSFDKNKVYNLFRDYPYSMTEEEIKMFDAENPYWAEFFKERKNENGSRL